jgi:hypothetical protein
MIAIVGMLLFTWDGDGRAVTDAIVDESWLLTENDLAELEKDFA